MRIFLMDSGKNDRNYLEAMLTTKRETDFISQDHKKELNKQIICNKNILRLNYPITEVGSNCTQYAKFN